MDTPFFVYLYANRLCNQTLRPNAISTRYHKTRALMGATRPASGKVQLLLFSRACILFFHYPDAGRVAPLVLAFLQALNATTKR